MPRTLTLPTLPTVAILAIAGVIAAAAVWSVVVPHTPAGAVESDVATFGRRVLVIAPHPDDETLATGGTIHRLVASGAKVRLVIVSAGEGYAAAARRLVSGPVGPVAFRLLGDVRHAEGARAIADLGLAPSDVTFLGYPDLGIYPMWDASWDADTPVTGPTGATDVPYDWANRTGVPACGSELASDLAGVIRAFRPDTVIAPDTRETHNDHAALAAFALYAMDETGFAGRRLTSIVHYKLFPRPLAYLPESALQPPPALLGGGSLWYSVPLDDSDVRAKRTALDRYSSELGIPGYDGYLRSFIRGNELFCERTPARAATSSSDARPVASTTGTVVVTPRPGVAPLYPYAAPVGSVRMVRGPRSLWMGVATDIPISPSIDYRVSLRLIGGGRASERLDVLVRDGSATPQRAGVTSILPDGVTAESDGSTVWIRMPVDVLAGRTHLLLGASAGPPGEPPFRTAWRDVAL